MESLGCEVMAWGDTQPRYPRNPSTLQTRFFNPTGCESKGLVRGPMQDKLGSDSRYFQYRQGDPRETEEGATPSSDSNSNHDAVTKSLSVTQNVAMSRR